MKTPVELIKYFGKVIKEEPNEKYSFNAVNMLALKMGYIVVPEACNESTMNFLMSEKTNYNSTFYKTFEEVQEKDRLELFFDQILHYATTYGTDFTMGNGYVPNDGDIVLREQDFKEYKVITPCSVDEMVELCRGLLTSGIAMKETTLDVVVNFFCYNIDEEKFVNNDEIDTIANREAVVRICDIFEITPNKKFDLLRYILYKTTGSSNIIQNKTTFDAITYSNIQFDFTTLNEKQLIGLSSIFRRFKNIFLAFKKRRANNYSDNIITNVKNAAVINRLGRMAAKTHTPLEPGFWETLMTNMPDMGEVRNRIGEVTSYKLIQILNSLSAKADSIINDVPSMYKIRNGKVFAREGYKGAYNENYMINLSLCIVRELQRRIKAKGYKYIKLNPNVRYGLPSSEKNFIGNYPIGTSVSLGENNYIGIYWRNEWGTRDFDLHMFDEQCRHIGWNAAYKTEDNNSVLYSGDMTNADPEATEIMYCKNTCPNGIISVSRYNGMPGSQFRLFVGTEDIKQLKRNYMVNPDSIKFQSDIISDNQTNSIGVVYKGRFYVTDLTLPGGMTPYSKGIEKIMPAFMSNIASTMTINDIVEVSSLINIVTLTEEEIANIQEGELLDLSNPTKDTFISLFQQ